MDASPRTDAAPDPRVVRTRAAVLAAAWDVLAEVGFDRVTIELISERSGVARSTMYRHWQTREEILRDAFTEQARAAPHAEAQQAGARSELASYAVTFAAGLDQEWGRAAVTMAAQGLDDPEQRRAVLTFVDGNRADLGRIVDHGRAEGVLAADGDRDATVTSLIDVLVAPLFYRYLVLGRPADAEIARSLAEQAWRIVAAGN